MMNIAPLHLLVELVKKWREDVAAGRAEDTNIPEEMLQKWEAAWKAACEAKKTSVQSNDEQG